jgi:dTDP-4-dehydrorhamnose 3,5-epimerase
MEFETFDIEGLVLIKPRIIEDQRGYFIESYNQSKYDKILGRKVNFIQDNESNSTKGVLRGLHFQKPPFMQAKLVRVVKGEVQDIAVDIRKNSPSFGQHQSVILSETNKHQFFIPRGFAHAFLVLSEEAIFQYKVDNVYAPQYDSGIFYNDPELNIVWNMDDSDIILSEKDSKLCLLNDLVLET